MLVHAVERDAVGGAAVRSAIVCRMLAREGDCLTAQTIDVNTIDSTIIVKKEYQQDATI